MPEKTSASVLPYAASGTVKKTKGRRAQPGVLTQFVPVQDVLFRDDAEEDLDVGRVRRGRVYLFLVRREQLLDERRERGLELASVGRVKKAARRVDGFTLWSGREKERPEQAQHPD